MHKPGHFQYTIDYEGNPFLVHGHKKDLPHITCIFRLFKYLVKILFSVSHISSHFFAKTLT